MEQDGSQSQLPHGDSYVSPNFLLRLVEKTEGLQERVENILEEIKQDGNFSEITEELYDQKRSYLTRQLIEFSQMNKVLADQIRTKLTYSTPIGLYFTLSSDSTVFCVSQTEDSKSSLSLSSASASEPLISTNKLLISPVNNGSRTVKKTKAPRVILKKNFNYDGTKLKREELDTGTQTADLGNEKTDVIELQKEVAKLKKKLTVSYDVIIDLQQQRLIQDPNSSSVEQELQLISKQANSQGEIIRKLQERVAHYVADKAKHDNQITELNRKNRQLTSDISQLKNTQKTKDNNWKTTIEKLRKKLEGKCESLDDLNEKFDTVQAEKCSQDNLIQKMETCLNSLQADHVGVLVSFDIAQTVTNELRERVLELEKEVDSQKEVISVRDEEKQEAIRQISSLLEQYRSTY